MVTFISIGLELQFQINVATDLKVVADASVLPIIECNKLEYLVL